MHHPHDVSPYAGEPPIAAQSEPIVLIAPCPFNLWPPQLPCALKKKQLENKQNPFLYLENLRQFQRKPTQPRKPRQLKLKQKT